MFGIVGVVDAVGASDADLTLVNFLVALGWTGGDVFGCGEEEFDEGRTDVALTIGEGLGVGCWEGEEVGWSIGVESWTMMIGGRRLLMIMIWWVLLVMLMVLLIIL